MTCWKDLPLLPLNHNIFLMFADVSLHPRERICPFGIVNREEATASNKAQKRSAFGCKILILQVALFLRRFFTLSKMKNREDEPLFSFSPLPRHRLPSWASRGGGANLLSFLLLVSCLSMWPSFGQLTLCFILSATARQSNFKKCFCRLSLRIFELIFSFCLIVDWKGLRL